MHDEYCKDCAIEHSICPLVPGCPCCDETREYMEAMND